MVENFQHDRAYTGMPRWHTKESNLPQEESIIELDDQMELGSQSK